ncbi:MAG: MarR family transcriptional regulator [Desulfobulbus sp.]|nr:MAG: MarR family transcriptional regulator [Desulfobulbus sp.]
MKQQKKSKKESLGMSTFSALQRATSIVANEVHKNLGSNNLTVSQFGVLEALHVIGPMYQRDLAEQILKTTGNITTVIDNLEKRELVKRVREVKDRRFFQVVLTPEGEKLIRRIYPAHVKRVQQVMDLLTAEEQEEFKRLCMKIEQAIEEK